MSEVPEGVEVVTRSRDTPRPTATMTLTRDGPQGVEVLLGLRSKTMRAFPNYWAFPGGGVSSVDRNAVKALPALAGPESASIACIMREMCEELGLAPTSTGAVAIDEKHASQLSGTKNSGYRSHLNMHFPLREHEYRR